MVSPGLDAGIEVGIIGVVVTGVGSVGKGVGVGVFGVGVGEGEGVGSRMGTVPLVSFLSAIKPKAVPLPSVSSLIFSVSPVNHSDHSSSRLTSL